MACNEQISLNELWKAISEIAEVEIKPKHWPEWPGNIHSSLADIIKAEKLFKSPSSLL